MENEFFCLELAGVDAWDVFTRDGRFAGLLVTKKDGTIRHRYNSTGSRGSSKKFLTIDDAVDSIIKRRKRIFEKK